MKTDGITVAIKGFAWDVPELALLPLGSKITFVIGDEGYVTSVE